MAQTNKHVKRFDSEHLSGTITIVGDEVTIEFEYLEKRWGTIFVLFPWLKSHKVKRTVVCSRTKLISSLVITNHRDYDRYSRHGELDPVLINVLNDLCIEAFNEYDEAFPTLIPDRGELTEDEVNSTIKNIITGNTLEDAVADEYVESQEGTINQVLAETDREIEAGVRVDLTEREHGNGGYISPSPAPEYVSPSPSPSYDYSSPSPSPSSYESSSSSSSSSSDSGSSSCD